MKRVTKRRQKILVVDDDLEVTELLRLALKQAGYDVASAKDGLGALDQARSLLPDLILLDLVLPELDGFSVCETLRRDRATAEIPIILLTGLSSELNRFAGLDCGANDYLPKPINLAKLLSRIRTLLNKAEKARPGKPAPGVCRPPPEFPVPPSSAG